jgi:hypothetical protein
VNEHEARAVCDRAFPARDTDTKAARADRDAVREATYNAMVSGAAAAQNAAVVESVRAEQARLHAERFGAAHRSDNTSAVLERLADAVERQTQILEALAKRGSK